MKKPASFLFLAALSLTLCANGGGDRSAVEPVTPVSMEIVYLEGTVLVDDEEALLGQTVPKGAVVTTGDSGLCEIVFAEKNIIRIEENTITTLSVGQGLGQVAMERGTMAFLLEKLDALGLGGGDFNVQTPLVAAGIRGTAFFVKTEGDDSVYFCDCNGRVSLEDPRGENTMILEAEEHKAVRYEKKDGAIVTSSPGLLYHNSEDMNSLADRIDHTIPWGAYSYD